MVGRIITETLGDYLIIAYLVAIISTLVYIPPVQIVKIAIGLRK